ncbi:DNA polymerase III subunit delta' [Vagococcus carniphilus]|uniref:DNA polymerase III subunit delta n=1 Tax=Vagococcus carniphilus TaxID=218144 RepID=A0AAW8UBW8_9ENTE|nr:DNA polymerase III subunit delta' [Vagococcus carniphilus]MDT2830849.1 DNA polymerase III subunit delta' [Vagococcus carniphilus]MDT2834458.1 DNA polymerase III subunit delta' [Vagococcus carniphilus]MDT2839379.1 DNA polymerase III subunit delta' [Vagococcus carniphilus]MDT2854012.1 DNA polymerase III subunit delta' [Vagococcus carniphilus]
MEKLIKNRVEEEQPQWMKIFKRVIGKNQLTHAYLFEGQDIDSTYDFSLWVAQGIYCQEVSESSCGECSICRRIETSDFPDVTTIIPEGQTIKVDQIRDIKQTFIRSGMESRTKVLIVKNAEKMTTSAANSLLKFIEEPDGMMYIFFLTNNINKILPTIQSRCQHIFLKPMSKQVIASTLEEESSLSKKQAELIAELVDSKQKAVELSSDEWFNSARETVSKWFQYLEKKNALAFLFVQQYLVKMAKEKEQQFLILDLLLSFYRLKLKEEIASEQFSQRDSNKAIEKILFARRKMEANVSFQNVCEQLVWQLLF